MSVRNTGVDVEAARARTQREIAEVTNPPPGANWTCNNCHRQFPGDTHHVKCPGKPAHSGQPMEPCGGKLIRWKEYEVKS